MSRRPGSGERRVEGRSLLSRISLFEGLDERDLDLLLGISRARELAPGELLFRKGELGDRLYGVLEGRLRVSGEPAHGESVAFNDLEPGEVLGEIALLDASPRSGTVEALEPSLLISLERADFFALLDRTPGMAVRLAGLLAARLRKLSGLFEDTVATLPSRLALNLVALARVADRSDGESVSLDISLPQTSLAELCSESTERLATQLRDWEARGLLGIEHGVVTVNGLDGLESLARFLVT